jgi:hypothetical protein
MDIKIAFDAPKGWTRRALLYVATPLALVAVTAAIASAGPVNPIDTSWIAAPNPISAALLKGNLDDLQKQSTDLQATAAQIDTRLTTIENTLTLSIVIDENCNFITPPGPLTEITNGMGDCTILFNSAFSAAPTCVATSNGSNGVWPHYTYVTRLNGPNALGRPTITGARVRTLEIDNQAAAPNSVPADGTVAVICVGPK